MRHGGFVVPVSPDTGPMPRKPCRRFLPLIQGLQTGQTRHQKAWQDPQPESACVGRFHKRCSIHPRWETGPQATATVSVIQPDGNPPVIAAFVDDFTDGQPPDLADACDMGATAGLQVDLCRPFANTDQPQPAMALRRPD